MSQVKIDLVIIDPQNDFIDKEFVKYVDLNGKQTVGVGALAVPGAWEDSKRLATLIDRIGGRLNDIHVTMDSHRMFDVAHPGWWRNGDPSWESKTWGAMSPQDRKLYPYKKLQPDPFTMITPADLLPAGANQIANWIPALPYPKKYIDAKQGPRDYVERLAATGRYPLVVWPEHCLIGSPGHNINDEIYSALQRWEKSQTADVDFVTKGSNPYTEHYSAVKAEVPDVFDSSTSLNSDFIGTIEDCERILFAGQAKSHCVANTVRDIIENFGDENAKKIILLEDCMSNVPGFEKMGDDFIAEMKSKGVTVMKSTDYS